MPNSWQHRYSARAPSDANLLAAASALWFRASCRRSFWGKEGADEGSAGPSHRNPNAEREHHASGVISRWWIRRSADRGRRTNDGLRGVVTGDHRLRCDWPARSPQHSCAPPPGFRPSAARSISSSSRYFRPRFSRQSSGQRNLTRLLEAIAL